MIVDRQLLLPLKNKIDVYKTIPLVFDQSYVYQISASFYVEFEL